MAYDMTATIGREQKKIEGTYPIDMYVVNASHSGTNYMYYANINQNVVGWELNATGDLTTGTVLYQAVGKIERGEFGNNLTAEIPELSVAIPNVDRSLESAVQTSDYLRGNEVYIITGFAKHLPSDNPDDDIGGTPDHNAFYKERYYVDSVISDENVITFSCKSKFDVKQIVVPGRRYTRDCGWLIHGGYLGSNCDLNGSINSASFSTCDGTLEQCRERQNDHRFGGFPSMPRRGVIIIT